jgi:hypothetical protein
MSDEQNAILALKNAWTGAVAAAAPVRALGSAVEAVSAESPLATLDLEHYHAVVLAEAIAVEALRGLIEQLRARLTPATP